MPSDVFPTRANTELEALADELNQKYFADRGRSLTIPIPIEDMAERFLGYSIDITDQGLFRDRNFLGGIDFEQNIIFINASIEDHDGRYSFTLAHEIGHHALHRDLFMQSRARDANEILCRDAAQKPQIEVEADRFAAALLMPSHTLRAALRAVASKPKISTTDSTGSCKLSNQAGGF